MKVRTKFTVSKVSEIGDGNGKRCDIMQQVGTPERPSYESTGVPFREVTLTAQYDPNKNPEDVSFSQATPTGSVCFSINNPDLKDEFKPGQAYYVDFTPVEQLTMIERSRMEARAWLLCLISICQPDWVQVAELEKMYAL